MSLGARSTCALAGGDRRGPRAGRGQEVEVQRGAVKRRAGVEGKSAGAGPRATHRQGAGAALPPHGFSHGRAPGPLHRVRRPCPSRRGSYTPPCTAQETRGICSHLDHSPFTARNVLIPHIQPHGDSLHPPQPHGMHSTLPQVRPYTTLREWSSYELAIKPGV